MSEKKGGKIDLFGIELIEKLLKRGMYIKEIAEIIGCHPGVLGQWIKKHNIKRHNTVESMLKPYNPSRRTQEFEVVEPMSKGYYKRILKEARENRR